MLVRCIDSLRGLNDRDWMYSIKPSSHLEYDLFSGVVFICMCTVTQGQSLADTDIARRVSLWYLLACFMLSVKESTACENQPYPHNILHKRYLTHIT